ncbi:MAG: hypothetical protein ACK5CY_06990 [Bacteroidia bacterium]
MRIFILIAAIVLPSIAMGQVLKSFSSTPAQFLEELTNFMESADKKATKELMEKFEPLWQSKLTPTQQSSVIAQANAMLKKRMTAFPNYKNYLRCLIAWSEANKSAEQFNGWHEGLGKCITKLTTGKFDQYLQTSEDLFSSNALYKSEAISWIMSRSDFTFAFDSIPKVIFETGDLKAVARYDSSHILMTSGVLYPTSFKFYGKSGKILWTRTGLTEEQANAKLKNYELSVKSTKFSADSATLHYPKYFKEDLLGVVSDKLTDNAAGREDTYPRFSNYNTSFAIKEIYKNVDFTGGITIQGNQLLGYGTKENRATFVFNRNSKPFLVAQSSTFLIEEKSLQSSSAAVKIFIEEDSIVHPGLTFRYQDEKKELNLIRNMEGVSQTPYYNSFHQIDMDFEVMQWKIDEPTIRFKALAGTVESKAIFESSDYFREGRFIEIQGIDAESPLMVLRRLADKVGRDELSFQEIVNWYRMDQTQVQLVLYRLSYMGFILYDDEAQRVVLKPRLRKYLLAAAGKSDYDVIQFFSNVSGSDNNAELSLLNGDLRMYGVERIFLSDSQNVVIYPKNQQLTVRKNRNFDFAGRIMAGRFEFFGKKFDFDYDKFKINLENVDSLRLRVATNERDEFGKIQLKKVKTIIENVIGDLLIDHPINKSGVRPLAQYPIFNSVKNSYTYYDRGSILGGVYKRSNFYFQLDPYQVDSLDNFSNEGLVFDGTFVSANIFPDLREKLRLQEDYSLGFKRTTESEGMPIYQSKGTFINKMQLSHKGLRGEGEIKYITTTAKSEDFVFFPDSVNAFCKSITVKPETQGKIEYADVEAADVKLHWEPYKPNKFEFKQTTTAISMYSGESKLKGKISIGEDGMTGAGTLEFASAEIESKQFRFKKEDFKSDTASFAFTARDVVKEDGTKEVAIKTDNVKADVSFKNRMGQFKSNAADSYIEFPVNKYIAYMDELRWYMDKDEVDMNSSMNEIDLIGSRFVSVRPDQDSITFVAPRAKYAMADRTIRTQGVKLIRIADATIYPDGEKLDVERNAVITTLKNSKINANNDTKYHDIYNASVDIISKHKYTASGDYDYEDASGKLQKLTFTTIAQDSAGNTTGTAKIEEAANFTLSPEFEFKGEARLWGPSKFLTFTGGARIVHKCAKAERAWFKFKTEIDPSNIQIPIDSLPKSVDGEKLIAGLVLVKDSTFYVDPVFLSKKQKTGDVELFTSRGILTFDKGTSEYRLTTKEKYQNAALADDYLAMNQLNCDMNGEGKISFGLDLGQVKVASYGKINHGTVKNETSIKTNIALDFFLAPELWKHMEETILATTGLQASDVSSEDYKKSMTRLIGKESADKLFREMGSSGVIKKFPDELNHSLVFTNVELKWNAEYNSYVSEGWLHLSNMGKSPFNKVIKGKIELVKKRGGDVLNLYLECESQKWYFFNYSRNVMNVIGGDENFNKIIRELDSKKRSVDGENGGPPYSFMIGVEKRKRDFMER